MATDTAFDAIRAFIEANWDAAACSLAWDNEEFDPPEPDAGASWGRVLVDGDLWERETIGTGSPATDRWDENGSVTLIAFVPVRTGSRLCRQRLREFADMLRGQDIGAIEFTGARFDPIGATDEKGNWWGMTVSVTWIKRG
jgi:hypothetical protein